MTGPLIVLAVPTVFLGFLALVLLFLLAVATLQPFAAYAGAPLFAPGTVPEPLAPNRLRWNPPADLPTVEQTVTLDVVPLSPTTSTGSVVSLRNQSPITLFMATIGLAFFIEYLDTSVKTIDEVERSLQAPVLGVLPERADDRRLHEGGERCGEYERERGRGNSSPACPDRWGIGFITPDSRPGSERQAAADLGPVIVGRGKREGRIRHVEEDADAVVREREHALVVGLNPLERAGAECVLATQREQRLVELECRARNA